MPNTDGEKAFDDAVKFVKKHLPYMKVRTVKLRHSKTVFFDGYGDQIEIILRKDNQ